MGADLDKILADEYLTNSTRRELEDYIIQKQLEARINELDNLGYKTGQVSFHSTEIRYKELQAELTTLKEQPNA